MSSFHSEGNILSTIWGLLFWDILFSPVPGAFETPYQSAPLDIATECFYFSRKEAIERRLHEIKEGKAPDIIAEVDDKYRENNTMCVGVRWNDFTKQELVEIVTVRQIPTQALNNCRLKSLFSLNSVSVVKDYRSYVDYSVKIMEEGTVVYPT